MSHLPPETLNHGLFIIWPGAFQLLQKIRNDLHESFEIHADLRIYWSEKNIYTNMCRLYNQPIQKQQEGKPFFSPKASRPELHIFYVSSSKSNIGLHCSQGCEIEEINLEIAEKKMIYRNWARDFSEYPYLIHAAASFNELRLQTPLLLGAERTRKLWSGGTLSESELDSDLAGSNGWISCESAFEILTLAVDWCVLRDWENLPKQLLVSDLDLLVADPRSASSALALSQSKGKNGYIEKHMRIGKDLIECALHWIGDGYLDTSWESSILKNRVPEALGIYRPSDADALFSLLYFELIYNQENSIDIALNLKNIIGRINHNGWLSESILDNRDKCIELLNGYMWIRNYASSTPVVPKYKNLNKQVIAALHSPHPKTIERSLAFKLTSRISSIILPKRIRNRIIAALKTEGIIKS